MKYLRWMKCSKTVLILCLLMPLYGISQTDSTTKYQNFSRQQLLTFELQRVARIFPQAESYYHQNKTKDEINAKQSEVIDTLLVAFEKTEVREKIYIEQLKLKDEEIEIVKPKWWQEPLVIVGEIILALITGVMIAK